MVLKPHPICALALLLALCFNARSQSPSETYNEARKLYSAGLYVRASQLFDSIGDYADSKSYMALCALKLHSPEAMRIMAEASDDPSSLRQTVLFEYARNLFDAGEYDAAAVQLDKVKPRRIQSSLRPEYFFKRGYCDYALGRYPEAEKFFREVERYPSSDYSAPSRYSLGFICYTRKDFEAAEKWFALSSKDSRFRELSDFYIVDCRFARKDYDYVLEQGTKLLEVVPDQRRARLCRLLSEASLVKGDAEKARLYFLQSDRQMQSRSDFFYAGSVLYAVKDYPGAIELFSRMGDFADSLGQIASYQLGHSYVQARNKIAALDCFKTASASSFDPAIEEDAFFNYAKLAFDLNGDTSVFKDYVKKYATLGKGPQIYGYMALTALYDKDYAAALDAYSQIDELDASQKSSYIKCNYLRAAQLMEGGSYKDATQYLKAASYYSPRRDALGQLSRYYTAECYFHTGNYKDALSLYQDLYNISALDKRVEGVCLPYNIAYCHLEAGRFKDASTWLDKYLATTDKTFREDALVRRGDCDFVQNLYSAATVSYGKALAEYSDPDKVYPYYRQALCYGLCGDVKSKIKSLLPVLSASVDAPYRTEAMYELARAQFDAGRNDDALATFSKVVEESVSDEYRAKALIGLGMVYRNSSRYETALDFYKKVVVEYPETESAKDALLAVESICQSLKRPEEYLAFVESSGALLSKSPEEREMMYFNTAEQLYLAGKYEEASRSLQKYISTYPEGRKLRQAKFYLAESCLELSDKERACELFREVSDGSDSFAETSLLKYSRLSYSLERFADARDGYALLKDRAAFDANRLEAMVGLMRSAFKAKDYDRAIEACTAVNACDSISVAERREALYLKSRSYLLTSRREEALKVMEKLAEDASSTEGAEARLFLIQDKYDRGDFEAVEKAVYDFTATETPQMYQLAKAFLILGDSFVQRGNLKQAKTTFESIRDGYEPPTGGDDIRELVQARLENLVNLMGNE